MSLDTHAGPSLTEQDAPRVPLNDATTSDLSTTTTSSRPRHRPSTLRAQISLYVEAHPISPRLHAYRDPCTSPHADPSLTEQDAPRVPLNGATTSELSTTTTSGRPRYQSFLRSPAGFRWCHAASFAVCLATSAIPRGQEHFAGVPRLRW